MPQITRRSLLAAASGLALTAAITPEVAARQSATPEASPVSEGTQPDGSWQFTDDRGITIHTGATPSHIIAQTTAAAALWDFGIKPVGIYGPSRAADGTPDLQAGNLDLDTVTVLGDYGEFDLEGALALQADLYVDVDRGGGLWYVPEDLEKTLLERFPTLAILAANVMVTETIARFEALSAALGADLGAPAVVEAKARWTANETAFKHLLAEKQGVKILGIAPSADQVFILNPKVLIDLSYYVSLGADFVVPENPTPSTFNNFEQLSWEQIGKYAEDADLILVDQRSDLSVLDGIELWQQLPAVQAGQVGTWYGVFPFSYTGLGDTLQRMIDQVSAANPL